MMNGKWKSLLLAVILGASAQSTMAQTTWYVGHYGTGTGSGALLDPFSQIQAAIGAAANGDTVLVAPGTYLENIDFLGKAIHVVSAAGPADTIIDGSAPSNPAAASVVSFKNDEGRDSIIEGFQLVGGTGTNTDVQNWKGGGVLCWHGTAPTIRGNDIHSNHVNYDGGGIWGGHETDVLIEGNWIHHNSCPTAGGGICVVFGRADIVNNLIYANLSANSAGGIMIWEEGADVNAPPTRILNCTVFGNISPIAAGIACHAGLVTCDVTILNTILWGNFSNSGTGTGNQLWLGCSIGTGQAIVNIDCSDVEGGNTAPSVYVQAGSTLNWGLGVISSDPLFVNPGSDFHLQQDPCQAGITSPCVDTGCAPPIPVLGSTRTCDCSDPAPIDMGYHYPTYPVPENFGPALPNSTGQIGTMGWGGSTSYSSNNLTLKASDLPAYQFGLFIYNSHANLKPFGAGIINVGLTQPPAVRIPNPVLTDSTGDVALLLDFSVAPFDAEPGMVKAGDTLYFQFWHRDPLQVFNLTDGLRLTLCY